MDDATNDEVEYIILSLRDQFDGHRQEARSVAETPMIQVGFSHLYAKLGIACSLASSETATECHSLACSVVRAMNRWSDVNPTSS